MINEGVGISERYVGAWGEIGVRIDARQSVNVYWASITLTGATAAIGLSSTGQLDRPFGGFVGALAAGLDILSWTFALLVRNHDAAIGLSSKYCAALELASSRGTRVGGRVENWHSDRRWIGDALRYRITSDYAHLLVQIAAVTPSIFVVVARLQRDSPFDAIVIGIAGLAGFASVLLIAGNTRLRNQIAKDAVVSRRRS